MILPTIAFIAGLVIGWNFLEQPKWVADLVAKYLKK